MRKFISLLDSKGIKYTLAGGKLVVPGYLNLSGCTALTALPKDLKVGWYLYLSGCTALTALPKDLKVGGPLDLIGERFPDSQRGTQAFNEAAASYRKDPEAATTAVLTYKEDHWRSALARAILGGGIKTSEVTQPCLLPT